MNSHPLRPAVERIAAQWSQLGFTRTRRTLSRNVEDVRQVIELEVIYGELRVNLGIVVHGVPNTGGPDEEHLWHIIGFLGGNVGPASLDPGPLTQAFMNDPELGSAWADEAFRAAIGPFFEKCSSSEKVRDFALSGEAERQKLLITRNYRRHLGIERGGRWVFYLHSDRGDGEG